MTRIQQGIRFVVAIAPVAWSAACGPPPQALIVRTVAVPVKPPDTITGMLALDQIIVPARPAAPFQIQTSPATNRISLTAVNADVRELLPALARAAGISLIMLPDVRGRVSVYLRDVSALDALKAVINEARLVVGEDDIPRPFGPVVFYQLPVNVNNATAATIKSRFGVSDSLANWLVLSRIK